MKSILVISVAMIGLGLFGADSKLPDWALATNGKETSYINEILSFGLITDHVERAFLEKIAHEEAKFPLAKALGYVAKRDRREAEPNETALSLYGGEQLVQSRRMQLAFHAIDKKRGRHVLVFKRQSEWSQLCDICAVVTDNTFNTLAWREGQRPLVFGTGTLQGRGKEFEYEGGMPLVMVGALESVSAKPVTGISGDEWTAVVRVKRILLGPWKEKRFEFGIAARDQVPLSPQQDHYIIASQDRGRVLIGAVIPLNEESRQPPATIPSPPKS